MTGNKSKDCIKQLKSIKDDHAPYTAAGWVPTTCDKATFFRLIKEHDLNQGHIDRGAFEDAGFSVIASGGKFGDVDIRAAITKKNQDELTKVKFVGAVEIESTVFTSGVHGDFNVMHDPHPFEMGGKMREQEPSHFSVVCVKSEELVDMLVEKPKWAVKPSDLEVDSEGSI